MSRAEDPTAVDWTIAEKRAAQAELLEMIAARPTGDGTAVGDTPEWFGPVVFGGFVLGQTLHAAATTVDDPARRPHSLHAYFQRPVNAGEPVEYRVVRMRDGRSFSLRRIEAAQRGRTVCTMMCSFTSDTDGYEYELDVTGPVPGIDEHPEEQGPGPWLIREVGPSPPEPDGTRRSTRRVWMRLPDPLPDDAMLAAAVVTMMTDMTGTGGRPLHLEGGIEGMVSLDHAAWFHRPLRPHEWTYYDVHSLVNAGGRGTLRGTLHGPEGTLAVSVAQEMLLAVV